MVPVELTILGSGTCAATRARSMAGYHLRWGEQSFLVDIGAGALRRLLEAEIPYIQIQAVFISHLHVDHVADLVPFLWATRYTPEFRRTAPLDLFGPPGTAAWYERLAAAYGDWMLDLPFPLNIYEGDSTEWEWQGLRISTLPMYHSVPVNGYRFENSEISFVYTGDTGYHENVIALARNADWLLIECSFPDGTEEVETHLTPSQAGDIATAAGARRVILTHLYPACDRVDIISQCRKTFSGELLVARDLQRLRLNTG